MSEVICDYTREIVCPYCGHEKSDSWEMPDDGETECGKCGKEFTYVRDIDVSYTSSKLDEGGE